MQRRLTNAASTSGCVYNPTDALSFLTGNLSLCLCLLLPCIAGGYNKSPQASATGIPVTAMNQSYSTGVPPQSAPVRPQAPVPWSTGLCDCFDDVSNCCITFWCPCIIFGQIAEIVDRGATSCATSGALYTLLMLITGCACCYSCCYRSKMRSQYSLNESPCADCLVRCCCETCALCQEYRELKARGFDMSIGWHGNLEKQTRGVQMLAPVQGGMTMNR